MKIELLIEIFLIYIIIIINRNIIYLFNSINNGYFLLILIPIIYLLIYQNNELIPISMQIPLLFISYLNNIKENIINNNELINLLFIITVLSLLIPNLYLSYDKIFKKIIILIIILLIIDYNNIKNDIIIIILYYSISHLILSKHLGFTIYEKHILSSILSLYLYYYLPNINTKFINTLNENIQINIINSLIIFILLLFACINQATYNGYKSLSYHIIIILIVLYYIQLCYRFNDINFIFKLIPIILSKKHCLILLYWFILLSIILIIHPTDKSLKIPNILIRKIYHILCVVLFIPIIYIDKTFMALSFSIALSLFLILEILRYENIYPFNLLTKYIISYIDSRDMNRLVVTPIYLLLGCSLPLWFDLYLPKSNSIGRILLPYSGILGLGIEDSFVYFNIF